MSSWPQNNRSYFVTDGHGGGNGNGQYSSYSTVGHVGGGGGGQHDAAGGGAKRLLAPSHFNKKTTGGKKVGAGDDVDRYPSSYAYGTASNGHSHNGGYVDNHRGGYSGAYGSSPYSSRSHGGGGGGGGRGYSNGDSYSSYGGGTYSAGGGPVIPYNAPATYWSPAPPGGQDGTRLPMFISTKEVNMYAMPAAGSSQYGDGYNNDQKQRGGGGGGYNNDQNQRGGGGYSNDQKQRGGGGLFRPVLEAIGHFFDRKFGLHERD